LFFEICDAAHHDILQLSTSSVFTHKTEDLLLPSVNASPLGFSFFKQRQMTYERKLIWQI
jgi:hypothetical protein